MSDKRGPWKHRLTDIDPVLKRGVCAHCGPVRLKSKKRGTRWACSVAEAQWKGDGTSSWMLTQEERDALLESQGGVCAICSRNRKLVIDHCHETMQVRGIICHFCNTRLYLLESEWIEQAKQYLARYRGPHE